jgi:hypothetical protein
MNDRKAERDGDIFVNGEIKGQTKTTDSELNWG